MLSVGAIISGGFGLLRRRPLAVLVWGLIYAAVMVGMMFVMRPLFAAQASAMQPDGDPRAMMASLGAMIGRIFLMELVMLMVFTVLMTAAQRAVLRPAEPGFASIRLGMDEVRMFALTLLVFIGSYIGFVILAMVLGMIAALLATAVGVGAAGVAMLVAMLVAFGIFIWFEVRLCLAFPLTLLRRKIIIGESWRLTRGRFWTLFGAFLVLFLALLVLWMIVAALTQGAYWSDLMRGGLNPQAVQAAAERQAAAQAAFSPIMMAGLIFGGLVGGVTIAVFGGAVATAVRLLIDDVDKMAETFA
jgi:hypothetical protein